MAVFRSPSLLLLSLLKQADASPPDFLCPCEADVDLDLLDSTTTAASRQPHARPHRTLNRRQPSSSIVIDHPAPAILARRQRRVYDPDGFPRQYVRGPDGTYTLQTQYSFHGQDVTCSLQEPEARAPTNIDLSSNNGGDTYDPEATQAPVAPQTDSAYPSGMPKGWPVSGKAYPDKRVAIWSAILAAVIAAFIFGLIFWRRPLSRRQGNRTEKLRKLHFLDDSGSLEKGIPGRDEDPDISRSLRSRKRVFSRALSRWKSKAKSKLSHVKQLRPTSSVPAEPAPTPPDSRRPSLSSTSSPSLSATSLPSSRAPTRPSSPAPTHSTIPPDGSSDARDRRPSSSSLPPLTFARRTAPSPSPTPPPPPSPPPPPLPPHQYRSDPPADAASASPDHHHHTHTQHHDSADALDPDMDADAEGVVRPSPPAYRRSYSDQARPSADTRENVIPPERDRDRKLPPPPSPSPSRPASPLPLPASSVAPGAEDEHVEDLRVPSRVVPDSDRDVSTVPRTDDLHIQQTQTQTRRFAHVATDDKSVLASMARMASAPGEELAADASAPVWVDDEEDNFDDNVSGTGLGDADLEGEGEEGPRFLPQPPPRVPQRSLFEFASAPPPPSPSASTPSAPSAPFVEDEDVDDGDPADALHVQHLPVYER